MDKGHLAQLKYRFRNLDPSEVLQEIRIAELEAAERGPRLAWTIAMRNLLDIERKRAVIEKRFCCLYDPAVHIFVNNSPSKDGFEVFLEELDWDSVMRRQPLPVRKLAEFAKFEAERFEDVPYGIWHIQNLVELRRRVKKRYLEWDRDHSEKSYHRARHAIIALLRNHWNAKR